MEETIDYMLLNKYGNCVLAMNKYREYIYNKRRYIAHQLGSGEWEIEEATPTRNARCSTIGCVAFATHWQGGFYCCRSHLGNQRDNPAIEL